MIERSGLLFWIVLVWCIVDATLAAPAENIHVEKKPPTTRFVEFDPANPPADVKFSEKEDALARTEFTCAVKLKYTLDETSRRDNQWHVVARLGEIRLELALMNTIFLPKRATDKLRAHEMGHAQINARVYENAEEAARAVARQAMQKRWPGEGDSLAAAGDAATDAAVEWIGREYLKHTDERAYRIGQIYDELTRHGTNLMRVPDAIEQATQRDRQAMAEKEDD